MTAPLVFGIVGTGRMARVMARALARLDGVTLGGVASASGERARAFAAAVGAPGAHEDIEDLLADPSIDVIYVATETARHAAASIAALGAAKAVLCEKPFAVDASEGARVAAAAADSGAFFMEALWTPFLPVWRQAERVAREGRLGAPRHLAYEFGLPVTAATDPGLFDPAGGGVLRDRGCYGVTHALRLLGPVERVEAVVRRDAAGIDTHAALLLEHGEGGTAQITVSFDAVLGNAAALGCTGGSVVLDPPALMAETLRLRAAAPGRVAVDASSGLRGRLREQLRARPWLRRLRSAARGGQWLPWPADPYQPMLEDVIAAVRAGHRESPIVPLSQSLAVLAVLDAARAGSTA